MLHIPINPSVPRRLAVLGLALLVSACHSDRQADADTSTPSVKLVPGQSPAVLETYLKSSLSGATTESSKITNGLELAAEATAANATARASETGYSQTNTQVSGVDEADLVKYDGRYLYVAVNPGNSGDMRALSTATPATAASAARVRILATSQNGAPAATELASLALDSQQGEISGLYLHRNASNRSQLAVLSRPPSFGWNQWLRYDRWSNQHTYVSLFDVETPTSLTPVWSISIEGSLIDSRRIDNTLYLVTRHVPAVAGLQWYNNDAQSLAENKKIIDALTLADLLPRVQVQDTSPTPLVSSDNCYLPATSASDYYAPALVTISAINLDSPGDITSVCIGGHSSGLFASSKALYLFNDRWQTGTIIHKFGFTPAGPAYQGSGTLPGSLGWRAPAFRLSEKDGALIAVSTVFPGGGIDTLPAPVLLADTPIGTRVAAASPTYPTHHLSVLKENAQQELVTLATLPNSAQPAAIGKPNEDIYGVRYIGNRAYIVTYRKTDPLYLIDLSDVTRPAIAGELHVEGYSDYLHPLGEDYLIGIGKSATVEADIAWYQGVQVGMFDVRDIAAPTLIRQISLGKRGSETQVSYDHKALGWLESAPGHYRLTLPIQVHDGVQSTAAERTPWHYTGLQLFDISLTAGATIAPAGVMVADKASAQSLYAPYVTPQRGILHGEAVHYVYGDKVFSAPWSAPQNLTPAQ